MQQHARNINLFNSNIQWKTVLRSQPCKAATTTHFSSKYQCLTLVLSENRLQVCVDINGTTQIYKSVVTEFCTWPNYAIRIRFFKIDQKIIWLIDWLTDWSIHRSIDRLIGALWHINTERSICTILQGTETDSGSLGWPTKNNAYYTFTTIATTWYLIVQLTCFFYKITQSITQ